jgi:LCP family protein required for cell wall assembly
VLLLCVLAWIAGIALRTSQNLDAMIIDPSPTALLTSTPDTATVASLNEPEPSSEETTAAPTEAQPAPDSTPTTAAQSDTMQQVAITEAPPAGQPVNILLLGNDRRPDEPPDEYPRTDAIMLVRVDPQNNRIALLSLPRDLWMQIPGYWPNRINNAYQIGETHAPGSGLDLTRASVSSLTGLPINYVAMIDFQGFVGLIDTIGGINIDVEKELYDSRYPTMDYGYQVAHFVPGPQHMDGSTALIYSRIRHPDSDFFRIQRQQDVMVAIGERLHERGDLQNVLAADQISGALVGFVQTDMPRERIVGLMWALRHTDPANVQHYTVTSDMVSMGVGSDRYALVPNRAAINQLALAFMGEQ